MIDTIYVEEELSAHPRAREILRRFPKAARVPVARYTEVFNRKAQSFRLQKKRPALILARKHEGHVLECPPGYGIGGARNFYFSHMLNCIYDCRYCFLQGMYRSAHYVLFVNYEDFEARIDETLAQSPGEDTYFYSGYDGDSLAFEPVSRFVETFLPFFAGKKKAWLELRSKSTRIDVLLSREPLPNAVVAFSFTPEETSKALEHKVPDVQRRLSAMETLARAGWRLGLRFDPLIYSERYRDNYRRLFAGVFSRIPATALHSVSVGGFRMPDGYFRNVRKLYPKEPLFAGPLESSDGMVSYRRDLQMELSAWVRGELLERVPAAVVFSS